MDTSESLGLAGQLLSSYVVGDLNPQMWKAIEEDIQYIPMASTFTWTHMHAHLNTWKLPPQNMYAYIHCIHIHIAHVEQETTMGPMIATLLQPSPPGHGKVQKNQYKELITAPGTR